MKLEVWVGNIDKYAEGNLEGEWISLPQESGKLQESLERISENGRYETAIMDISARDDCQYMKKAIGEWSNLQELNAITKLIGEESHPAVEAFVRSQENVSLSDLANLLLQEADIPYYPYVFEGSENPEMISTLSAEEKMGYTVIEKDGQLKKLLDTILVREMPLGAYLDVEAIGRDASSSGEVVLYENGYLDELATGPDLSLYKMEDIRERLSETEYKEGGPSL